MFDFSEEFRRLQRDISRLMSDLERLFETLGSRTIFRLPPRVSIVRGVREPLADVYETEDKYVVVMEIPGVPKDKIELNVTNNTVEVKGKVKEISIKEGRFIVKERDYTAFSRIIHLPERVNPKEAKAKYEDGLLVIELPKAEVPKKVSIEIE